MSDGENIDGRYILSSRLKWLKCTNSFWDLYHIFKVDAFQELTDEMNAVVSLIFYSYAYKKPLALFLTNGLFVRPNDLADNKHVISEKVFLFQGI